MPSKDFAQPASFVPLARTVGMSTGDLHWSPHGGRRAGVSALDILQLGGIGLRQQPIEEQGALLVGAVAEAPSVVLPAMFARWTCRQRSALAPGSDVPRREDQENDADSDAEAHNGTADIVGPIVRSGMAHEQRYCSHHGCHRGRERGNAAPGIAWLTATGTHPTTVPRTRDSRPCQARRIRRFVFQAEVPKELLRGE